MVIRGCWIASCQKPYHVKFQEYYKSKMNTRQGQRYWVWRNLPGSSQARKQGFSIHPTNSCIPKNPRIGYSDFWEYSDAQNYQLKFIFFNICTTNISNFI